MSPQKLSSHLEPAQTSFSRIGRFFKWKRLAHSLVEFFKLLAGFFRRLKDSAGGK
ncbi:Hypothetical protein FKW44_023821 [Caligus rogercresseyi]|uniref:Uncharacterized protein n=1 Tax=Caligus rogercresseyi TaxID=217165 RepID=A0A7T8GPW3_CALRO|nr:Hypothetical protein FKW44_023821 [Caligus rogercresseyi]